MEECCRNTVQHAGPTRTRAFCLGIRSDSPPSLPVLPSICAPPSYIQLIFLLYSIYHAVIVIFPKRTPCSLARWFGIQRLLRVDYGVATTIRWNFGSPITSILDTQERLGNDPSSDSTRPRAAIAQLAQRAECHVEKR